MSWTAKITGDMTLSVLNEDGLKVLGIDMLSRKTMLAGTDGDLLARALNDLNLIAQAADHVEVTHLVLADPSAKMSPTPWRLETKETTRRLLVRDAEGQIIGERRFPASMSRDALLNIFEGMKQVIDIINASNIGMK